MTSEDILERAGFTAAELKGGSLVRPLADRRRRDRARPARRRLPTCRRSSSAPTRAFLAWREVPAPRRGELVRLLGEELRASKEALGALVTLEVGKIVSEGLGEVQEMIDICDFAVGLSRQLYGLAIASERPGHRMTETWHPLGPVRDHLRLQFPGRRLVLERGAGAGLRRSRHLEAVGEDAALGAGDHEDLRPRAQALRPRRAAKASRSSSSAAPAIGEALVASKRVPIVSATGSTRMGSIVGPKVAARFGRPILELGGNNAMIVAPSADLDMAVRAILFSAVGTAGQRCTSLRRVIAHRSIRADLTHRLVKAYASLPIGDPRKTGTLVGPLIDQAARDRMEARAQARAKRRAARSTAAERSPRASRTAAPMSSRRSSKCRTSRDIVREETFAPILYTLGYDALDEAIAIQNDVPQGLSSSIFTLNLREAETFLSASGSDCGIANVNIGPSGAEIGGAFGGEKETGGGRESGSDAWKAYMRRQTSTVNYSAKLPLAQGVRFDF